MLFLCTPKIDGKRQKYVGGLLDTKCISIADLYVPDFVNCIPNYV